jgi:hypothetical protein
MIVKPPRLEAEFSPRLKAISLHAADQFDDADGGPPLIPRRISRRLFVPILLVFAAFVFRVGLWCIYSSRDWPSSHAAIAEEYRARARSAEEQARVYRAIAATGKPGLLIGVGITIYPTEALQLAGSKDQEAAGFRDQAYLEERMNQGFPVP